MAHFGIFIQKDRFEVVAGGSAVGQRSRDLDQSAVEVLEGFAQRYSLILRAGANAASVLTLGRQLYAWLDGDQGQLTTLIGQVPKPFVFEVQGPTKPSRSEWALLRVPFELLANADGFLAQDALLRFCPVRRLGPSKSPPPPDPHRLGLVFMASAPRGQVELDYEAEETAILDAVSERHIDLVVEESGDPTELGVRLRDLDTMQAVHLSCHGLNAWRPKDRPNAEPRPILMMEDREGNERPTDAVSLLRELRPVPRLVFLSACLSAAAVDRAHAPSLAGDKLIESSASAATEQVAHSLATALIAAGLPAVLGWEGSVADRAATAFAADLYAGLAREVEIAEAVSDARRSLINSSDEVVRGDWHLARLWVRPEGGGAIVGGSRKRSLLPISHGHKIFLDAKGEVPVAAPEMFVGRRRRLQKALRVLRAVDYAGVLLHGMGRLGKSSLAARIVSRCQDRMTPAVLFKHYDALALVEVLETALKTFPAARDLLRQRKDQVRNDRTRLEDLLVDLLSGPCAQTADDSKPLLLVIDDLERILEPDPSGGRHKVASPYAEVLGIVLRAFDPTTTDSRLIVTSRYPFTLDGLETRLHEIPLPPLSEAAQRKLELRQTGVAQEAKIDAVELVARLKLLPRVRSVARGNPGLQDLIGQRLVLSKEVARAQAETALRQMEVWLTGGDLSEETEVRTFLENLTIDTLLDLAGPTSRDLLTALMTFNLPMPAVVLDTVAEQFGGSVMRLRDLGLLDVFEDLVDDRTEALAVNGLASSRLPRLDDAARTAIATVALSRLSIAWGGDRGRPPVADLELSRLGLMAGDAEVVAASAAQAMRALEGRSAVERARFGEAAIALLEQEARAVPWLLLSDTASAVATAGEGATADMLLSKGVNALEARHKAGEAVDPLEAGYLLLEQGRRLVQRGELVEAEPLFARAAGLALQSGRELDAAVARGHIADILQTRGELDEALRILTGQQLPTYQRLGEMRAIAITKGQIADILQSRTELDEALRIRTQEELPVYERLGDVRSVAITKGQIADIIFGRGELEEALRIRTEEQLPERRSGRARAFSDYQ
jgi:CHAT domain-containing protein